MSEEKLSSSSALLRALNIPVDGEPATNADPDGLKLPDDEESPSDVLLRALKTSVKKQSSNNAVARRFTADELIRPDGINLTGEFTDQVYRIMKAVRLTPDEISSLSLLYSDLQTVLQEPWPGCTVEPFGSLTTGLGLKNSDADCFINIPRSAISKPPDSSAELVKKASTELEKFPEMFVDIRPVNRPNMPIVKLFHITTNKFCDVTFKSDLGTRNSKLIAFLLHSDPRLLPMAVVLKYWAKVYNISGTTKLKNYALSLLIIFYLQQSPLEILPSIQWLQSDPAYDKMVHNWNSGFINKKSLLSPTSNTSSISELLGGFFDYYSKFDFDRMVVCPYLGRPIEKNLFKDIDQLPKEFELLKSKGVDNIRRLKFNSVMAVQDPFDHSHNIGSPVSSRLLSDFQYYLKITARTYENDKVNDCKHFLRTTLLNRPRIFRNKISQYSITLTSQHYKNNFWRLDMRPTVCTIFEKMLMIPLQRVEHEEFPELKDKREIFIGRISKPVWRRNPFLKIDRKKVIFQQKQEEITERILNDEIQIFEVQFKLILVYQHAPFVTISIIDGDQYAFNTFGEFCMLVMRHWYKKLLKCEDPRLVESIPKKITTGIQATKIRG